MFRKNTSIKLLLSHIGLFIVVEIIFVLIVFRELPEVNLYTKIGIAHLIYRGIVVLCSLRREKAQKVIIRFIALRIPMVIHLFIHVRIGLETIEEHTRGREQHDEELLWLIIGTLIAGFIVYQGEKLLHRNNHCETHHMSTHDTCVKNDCGDCDNNHK